MSKQLKAELDQVWATCRPNCSTDGRIDQLETKNDKLQSHINELRNSVEVVQCTPGLTPRQRMGERSLRLGANMWFTVIQFRLYPEMVTVVPSVDATSAELTSAHTGNSIAVEDTCDHSRIHPHPY